MYQICLIFFAEFSDQDTGHLSSTPSTPDSGAAQPDLSFRGLKRKAAESESSAYKKRQIEFRDRLEAKLDSLIEKGGITLEKMGTAADEVASAAGRIASAAERIAAALEKVVGRL